MTGGSPTEPADAPKTEREFSAGETDCAQAVG